MSAILSNVFKSVSDVMCAKKTREVEKEIEDEEKKTK